MVLDVNTLQTKQKIAFIRSMKSPVLFYGGAKGGGKSYFVRFREIYRRMKYPNTKGIIIRKTYPELLSNHIDALYKEYPEIMNNFYNKAEKRIIYPNGSITEFSFLQNTMDVFNYQGREYEDITMDEATQHEEMVFKILRSSNRTSNKKARMMGLKPSFILTGNPGGIGHGWVKRLFVDKEFKENENPFDFDFVQAKLQDNPALLENDPLYLERLKDLPEYLRKAYLDGDWNIHAGQAFGELVEDIHVVEPFELPINTKYFAGYDHGFTHPFAFVEFAITDDGYVYVTNVVSQKGKRPDEIIKLLRLERFGHEKKLRIYAGHDLWSRGRDGAPTVFDQFFNLGARPSRGVTIIKAGINRIQGVSEIRKWIAWKNTETGKPHLYFFRNAKAVYDQLASRQYDEHDAEDVLKTNADDSGYGGDDIYDAFRYGIMSRAVPNKKEEKQLPKDSLMYILGKHLRIQEIRDRI